MNNYFVSYARKDSIFVHRLVKQLELLGANLFIDQRGIEAGERWERAIDEALRASAGVIVAISPMSVTSDYVSREWSFALDNDIKVIPILIEEAVVPARLKRFEHVDFTTHYSDAMSKIIKVLELDKPTGLNRILVSHDRVKGELAFVDMIVNIISSFGILPVIQKRAAVEIQKEGQMKTLNDCDALLSIVSKNPACDQLKSVQDELEYFDAAGKRNMMIAYEGINCTTLWHEREFISHSPSEVVKTMTTISTTLGFWKHDMGRNVRVRLELRESALSTMIRNQKSPHLQYRTWSDGRHSRWTKAPVVYEPGGITTFLHGVHEDQLLEVKLDDGHTTWKSKISPQVLYMKLNEEDM